MVQHVVCVGVQCTHICWRYNLCLVYLAKRGKSWQHKNMFSMRRQTGETSRNSEHRLKQSNIEWYVPLPPCPLFLVLDIQHIQRLVQIAHLSRPWSIGWVALSFLVRSVVCPAMVTSDQISTFFQYIQAYKPCNYPVSLNTKQYQVMLTQHHQVPTSTALY